MQFLSSPSDNPDRINKGKIWARQFTNEAMAEQTIKILEDAYHRDSREQLRRRAGQKPVGQSPVVTAAYFMERFPDGDVLEEIAKLDRKLSSRLQTIIILPENSPEAMPGNFEIMRSSGSFHEVIRNLAAASKGKHLFFSGGSSVPLLSFIDYLIVNDPATESAILEGDSYIKNGPEGEISCNIPVGITGEERKKFFCSNLSFVVRTCSFRDLLEQTQERFDSLPAMASRLWSLLPKEQVFRTVSMHIEAAGKAGDCSRGPLSSGGKRFWGIPAFFARLFSRKNK